MTRSNSFPKKATDRVNNVVVSDSESDYREEETDGTTTASNKTARASTRRPRATRRQSVSHKHHVKHYVEHNYHDHKHDPIEVPGTHDPKRGSLKRSGHKGGVSTPFPEKLHELLEKVGGQDKDDAIIGWQPHGRAFVIHKPKEFVSKIMPQFFKQSKLTSFQRQLNLYSFFRLTTGIDRGGYYHELFIRGRSDLCSRMVRTRVKGNGSKAASSPSTEPNFYNMEPCLAEDTTSAPTSMMEVDTAVDSDIQLFPENDLEEELMRVETPEPLPSARDILAEEVIIASASKDNALWNHEAEGNLEMKEVSSQAKFISLPPIVTPITSERRRLISEGDGRSPLLPMVASLDSIESPESAEGIHSGDQVFFEGLPFHYLELKDIDCV